MLFGFFDLVTKIETELKIASLLAADSSFSLNMSKKLMKPLIKSFGILLSDRLDSDITMINLTYSMASNTALSE